MIWHTLGLLAYYYLFICLLNYLWKKFIKNNNYNVCKGNLFGSLATNAVSEKYSKENKKLFFKDIGMDIGVGGPLVLIFS